MNPTVTDAPVMNIVLSASYLDRVEGKSGEEATYVNGIHMQWWTEDWFRDHAFRTRNFGSSKLDKFANTLEEMIELMVEIVHQYSCDGHVLIQNGDAESNIPALAEPIYQRLSAGLLERI